MSNNKVYVPLENRVCIDKSSKLCRRGMNCKCVHLDGASTCHNIMNGTPCDETCEGFAHTFEVWDAKNTELEIKLPRWTRNPKYVEFWAAKALEAEQDAFALADAEHDVEIQAAAEEFFAEQELIDELNTVFETVAAAEPQTPMKPKTWVSVVKEAPGAPKKINRLLFSDVENWGDIE